MDFSGDSTTGMTCPREELKYEKIPQNLKKKNNTPKHTQMRMKKNYLFIQSLKQYLKYRTEFLDRR